MKRFLTVLLALLLLLGTAACAAPSGNDSGKLKVVTTIFPLYDWVREVAGDDDCVELTLLLDNGVDLHSYSPSADDIVKIASCDLFVYVGGESDDWVDEVLASAPGDKRVVVNMMEALGDALREEETKEGMQAEEEDEEEEPEYDEHVWLSLRNAVTFCERIGAALGEVDAQHKEDYAANTAAYVAKLNALEERYAYAVQDGAVRTLLFADRFPFRYLVEDYNLDYYAAFKGCSAESEASFETMIFLAKKVDELGLHAILQTESADGSIARTVRENTAAKDQTVLTMNSLQSVTAEKVAQGATYLSVMEENLAVLKDALK